MICYCRCPSLSRLRLTCSRIKAIRLICIIISILWVYSPFSDRFGLPLHNIPFCHGHLLCRSQVLSYPLPTLSNHVVQPVSCFQLYSIHLFTQSLVTFPYHMTIPSQPTTSNDSCNRMNSNVDVCLRYVLLFYGIDDMINIKHD